MDIKSATYVKLIKIIISMENAIKLLAAIGAICSGIGEILKQYNMSQEKIRKEVEKILSDSPDKKK